MDWFWPTDVHVRREKEKEIEILQRKREREGLRERERGGGQEKERRGEVEGQGKWEWESQSEIESAWWRGVTGRGGKRSRWGGRSSNVVVIRWGWTETDGNNLLDNIGKKRRRKILKRSLK